MIECTLQEAVERCEKDGGKFYIKNENANTMGYTIALDGIIRDQDGEPFELETRDFREKWVYEPPKKSAFQEWHSKYRDNLDTNEFKLARKAGWDAAIQKVLNIIVTDGLYFKSTVEKIEELKEK